MLAHRRRRWANIKSAAVRSDASPTVTPGFPDVYNIQHLWQNNPQEPTIRSDWIFIYTTTMHHDQHQEDCVQRDITA